MFLEFYYSFNLSCIRGILVLELVLDCGGGKASIFLRFWMRKGVVCNRFYGDELNIFLVLLEILLFLGLLCRLVILVYFFYESFCFRDYFDFSFFFIF